MSGGSRPKRIGNVTEVAGHDRDLWSAADMLLNALSLIG